MVIAPNMYGFYGRACDMDVSVSRGDKDVAIFVRSCNDTPIQIYHRRDKARLVSLKGEMYVYQTTLCGYVCVCFAVRGVCRVQRE
jgi:hypothetical protein